MLGRWFFSLLKGVHGLFILSGREITKVSGSQFQAWGQTWKSARNVGMDFPGPGLEVRIPMVRIHGLTLTYKLNGKILLGSFSPTDILTIGILTSNPGPGTSK